MMGVYSNEMRTNKERALKAASEELELIERSYNLNIGKDKNLILKDYEKLYELGFTNGRKRSEVLKSLIIIHLRNKDLPIDFKDIKLNEKRGRKYIRKILKLLGTKLKSKEIEPYLIKYGNILQLKPNTISIAILLSKLKFKSDFNTRIACLLLLASKFTKDKIQPSDFEDDKELKEVCKQLEKKINKRLLAKVNKLL